MPGTHARSTDRLSQSRSQGETATGHARASSSASCSVTGARRLTPLHHKVCGLVMEVRTSITKRREAHRRSDGPSGSRRSHPRNTVSPLDAHRTIRGEEADRQGSGRLQRVEEAGGSEGPWACGGERGNGCLTPPGGGRPAGLQRDPNARARHRRARARPERQRSAGSASRLGDHCLAAGQEPRQAPAAAARPGNPARSVASGAPPAEPAAAP